MQYVTTPITLGFCIHQSGIINNVICSLQNTIKVPQKTAWIYIHSIWKGHNHKTHQLSECVHSGQYNNMYNSRQKQSILPVMLFDFLIN